MVGKKIEVERRGWEGERIGEGKTAKGREIREVR